MEHRIRPVPTDEILEMLSEGAEREKAELSELEQAIDVFQKIADKMRRSIKRRHQMIDAVRRGEGIIGAQVPVRSNKYADLSIPEAAFRILAQAEEPMHVKDIAEAMAHGGKKLKARRPPVSVAAALLRDSRFEKVAPNTFRIKVAVQRKLDGIQ